MKKNLLRLFALCILIALYALAVPPKISVADEKLLAADFNFTNAPLYEPPGVAPAHVRKVHPQYEKISAWISSVGAAITFCDIDNNGLCNDIIHVDPRYDKVLVSPAEGTTGNYQPFDLTPHKLPYDAKTTAPMGTLANDFNEDGKTDVLVYYWGRTPIIFYQTENGFNEVELTTCGERWFSNAATIADFDGDGQPDILITNYFPDGSRVLDANATDQDQTMQHAMSRAYNGGKDHFFLFAGVKNNQANYVEHNEWRGNIPNPDDWTLAVAAADINGDMLPEIYFANDFGPDKFFLNQSTPGNLKFSLMKGKKHLNTISSSVLGKDSFKGMGVDFGDINNDGKLDIYVSNICDVYALEESHFAFINTGRIEQMKNGIAPFRNESEKLGLSRSSWGWDSKLADFNNDGNVEALQATGFIKGTTNHWPELQELAMTNDEWLPKTFAWPQFKPGVDLCGYKHNPFFTRDKSGHFFDIANEIGVGQLQVTRGIAISDIDHDGDLDFAIANQWEKSLLYKNNYKGENEFLGLRILLPNEKNIATISVDPDSISNARFAIGAVVRINHHDRTTAVAFVDGGNGHSGKNSNEIYFGLGKKSKTEKLDLTITWRNSKGIVQNENISVMPGWHTIVLPY